MNTSALKILTLLLGLSLSSTAFSQYRANIKTNVLSLLLTIPQASIEIGLSQSSSITLSGFKGSFSFITDDNKVRGANLLLRKYFSDEKSLTGIYVEGGLIVNGEYLEYKNEWEDDFGVRAGLGWQFGRRIVFDIGAGLGVTKGKYEVFDANGLPSGVYMDKTDTFFRLNTSIGYRF